jgi:epoxyqueuosine reductase
MAQRITGRLIRDLAAECGFALAGVTSAGAAPDYPRFRDWVDRGLAGEMHYLTGNRAEVRSDSELLLPGARTVICVGMLYRGSEPYSLDVSNSERGWIARYAWGLDYHDTMRKSLQFLASLLLKVQDFRWRACVDTAPLLERSLAHRAGLGWIGKNTCLIHQSRGSWFLLGELLTTLDLASDAPPPDRCGTCTRCIDACPTAAIVPSPAGGFELDSRLCISYFTIELRDSIPVEQRERVGNNIFGCDICQDVCPWNGKRPTVAKAAELSADLSADPATQPSVDPTVPLDRMAALTEAEFKNIFRGTAISRAKYTGFLRNVAVAMGNSGSPKFRVPLEKLAASPHPLVAEHAQWALDRLARSTQTSLSTSAKSSDRDIPIPSPADKTPSA